MITEHLASELQYFVGKICTIMTPPMALPLRKPEDFAAWFTMMVDDIDQEAILGTDPVRGTKQVFFFPIMAISEEKVVHPDDPLYDTISSQAAPEGQVVQVDQLQTEVDNMKKKWSTSPIEKELS